MITDARLDHVAIAVRSIASAMPVYVDALGATFLFGGDNERQGFRWAQFVLPNGGKFEFVTPLTPDGFVAKFLERRGEGVHHVTLKTDDIEAALAELGAAGIEPMMVNLKHEAWKEAFLHPKQASGTLVQIAQSQFGDEELARHHLSDHSESGHTHLTFDELISSR